MSEREDEIARGVARALKEHDKKANADNAEGSLFAVCFFLLLVATIVVSVIFGVPLAWTIIVGLFGNIVIAAILAHWIMHRAKERAPDQY